MIQRVWDASQQAENAQIRRGGNERFSHMARHMHCLRLVSGILDTSSYPDFCVIPTFQKRPVKPTVLGRKVVITFCFPAERNSRFFKSRYNQWDFTADRKDASEYHHREHRDHFCLCQSHRFRQKPSQSLSVSFPYPREHRSK